MGDVAEQAFPLQKGALDVAEPEGGGEELAFSKTMEDDVADRFAGACCVIGWDAEAEVSLEIGIAEGFLAAGGEASEVEGVLL